MTSPMTFVRSNAVGFLALFVALGGTSYAAVSLPKNSVTAKQIAPKAVGTSEVKDGSLLSGDFAAGQLPAGATGPAGPAGAKGAAGPAGPAGRSALDTLKGGETVRGRMGGDFQAASAGGDWRAFASFPVPAASDPTGVMIDGVTAGETCAGTSDEPTAPAGYVCVYPLNSGNPVAAVGTHTTSSDSLGFHVTWSPTASGDTFFIATWAYTQSPVI